MITELDTVANTLHGHFTEPIVYVMHITMNSKQQQSAHGIGDVVVDGLGRERRTWRLALAEEYLGDVAGTVVGRRVVHLARGRRLARRAVLRAAHRAVTQAVVIVAVARTALAAQSARVRVSAQH